MARLGVQSRAHAATLGHAVTHGLRREEAETRASGRLGLGRCVLETSGFVVAACLTVWSAMVVKQAGHVPPLMAVATVPAMVSPPLSTEGIDGGMPIVDPLGEAEGAVVDGSLAALDSRVRWFNGRPIRPAHVMWMTVTAYTPGAESCWPSDDGETATLHCVTTNGGAMVAADTRVLPFGSLVSVAGYDDSRVVPVLDRGGKIRGARLDVLMVTVPEARAWGVRRVPVVVWEYADGQGATDPRRVR